MSKRLFVFTLLIVLAAVTLVGCGGAQPTAAPAAPPPAAAPQATQPAPAASAPVKLTLWHMEQPDHRVKRFQELIDKFNAANPGIVVSQEVQNWNDIYTKAPAAVAAGNAPDLLFTTPDFTLLLQPLGAVQPVDDLVTEMDQAHHFYPAVITPFKYSGHVWAVPIWNMTHSLWYRKSVFKAAGIDKIETWDEWQAAAKKLTAEKQYGMGLPANKQMYTDQVVYDFMINSGAEEIYNKDGSVRFDNPKTVAALDAYSKLYQYSPPDSPSWTWGEAEACFDAKTCAMVLQFTVISTYDAAGGDPADLGVMAIPHAADVTQSGTMGAPNAVMVMTKDDAKKQAAYKFLRFILEPDNYGSLLTAEPALFLPLTEDGAKSTTFWNDPMTVKYRGQVEGMIGVSQNGKMYGFTSTNIFPSIAKISGENMFAQALQKVVIDKQTPAAAATWGQQLMMQTVEQ
ncbi:MAG: extracellular solute-binding protein [Chloroflexi bacterium]|nr:extracellular solute-binding protein [Chloroflexota bacterium]